MHREAKAEQALNATSSLALGLASGMSPWSWFIYRGKKSPEHTRLLPKKSSPQAIPPGVCGWSSPPPCVLPGAVHVSALPVLLPFPGDDSIIYASFSAFPDIKNSCVFRASLSAVWSNLNCNLKELYFTRSFLNETLSLFFFPSPKAAARNLVRHQP